MARLQADADRIVEVIGIRGSEVQHGSGCIVAGRTVLTAAHVVQDAAKVIVRDQRKRELPLAWPPTGRRFVGSDFADGPDLALIELADPVIDFGQLPLAAINRDGFGTLYSCQAIGYPWVAETDHDTADGQLRTIRNVSQADGSIPLASARNVGLCVLDVASRSNSTDSAARTVSSIWAGMSGAPVLASGCLVGVVTDNSPHQDASALLFTPLTLLERTEDQPLWGSGVPEPEQWWQQLGVGSASALGLLPRPRRTATYPARVRQIADLIRDFEGREAEFQATAEFARGPEGYRLLEGVRYAGKTALLAKFVTAPAPPGVDVVSFFVSRRMSSIDSTSFLAALIPQLAELLGEPVVNLDEDAFYNLWQLAARAALQSGRHLLLVVDGLDEERPLPRARSIAQMLPVHVAGLSPEWRNAHVLVSNRQGALLREKLPAGHPLQDLRPHVLTQYRENADYEALARQEIADLLSSGPEARSLIGALTAARGALSVSDLVRLTGLPAGQAEEFLRDAHRSMPPVGDDRYAFDTEFLGQLEATARLDLDAFRAAIHTWADEWRSRGWRDEQGGYDHVPRYLVEAYPETLREAPDRRAQLASDPGWIAAAIKHLNVDSVLAKLGSWVRETPDLAGPAAMLAIVRGQAAFLRSVPGLEAGQLLRQLCLQAAELAETDQLAALLAALETHPGLAPQWSSRRPYRGLIAEINTRAGLVNAVALTPGGRIVVGADDGIVTLWDPSTPSAEGWVIGKHDRPVRALAVHPDGRIISGGDDRRICLWDPDLMNAEPVELGRQDGVVRALAVLDSERVISGGDDWWVRIWSLSGHGDRGLKLGQHAGNIRGIATDQHGRVVSGGDDGRILLWDPDTPGAPIASAQAIGVRVMTVAVAPDGSVIAGGNDGVLYRWYHQFCEGRADGEPRSGPLEEFGSHTNVVRSVAVAQDGIIVSGSDDGRLRRWQQGPRGTDRSELGRHIGAVRTVCAEGGHAVSGGRDQRVRFWDLGAPQTPDGNRAAPPERVVSLCARTDGTAITGSLSRKLWLWDPTAGPEPAVLGTLRAPALAICPLPGSAFATADAEGTIQAWDSSAPVSPAASGPAGLHPGALLGVAGEYLISGGYDGQVMRWELAQLLGPRNGRAQTSVTGHALGRHASPVVSVVALPDGQVVTGEAAGDIRAWQADGSGRTARSFERFRGRLTALAVLPGLLAGGGDDGQLWLWDLDTGRARAQVAHQGAWITAVAACGTHLVSAGTDGRMQAWAQSGPGLKSLGEVATQVSALSAAAMGDGSYRLAAAHPDAGASYWRFAVR